jgi:hypothetical protein
VPILQHQTGLKVLSVLLYLLVRLVLLDQKLSMQHLLDLLVQKL